VRFTHPALAEVLITGARFEKHNEHLVFLSASNDLAALFLLEGVSESLEVAEQTGLYSAK
jgi:hypothetical protein